MKKILIALLVCVASFSYGYKTLTTKNFYIHYPENIETAQIIELGKYAEGAYAALRKIFPYDVGKVHIEVHINSDVPNGNATVSPFNKINYYLTGADYDSEIGFRNWAHSLFIHELSHIFENDGARGYASILKTIFGKPPFNPLNTPFIDPFYLLTARILPTFMPGFFTLPNLTTPTWFDEGIAVFSESFFSYDGRLNSTDYAARYRENALFGFADMSQFTAYNTVSTPYAYGAGIFSQIYVLTGKTNFTGELSYIHAGRFYFFFDGGISTLLENKKVANAEDYTYTSVYELFKKEETQRQLENIKKLQAQPITRPQLLVNFEKERQDIKGLAISPDEKTIYIATDTDLRFDFFGGYSRDFLYAYDVSSKKLKKIHSGDFMGKRLEVGSSGKKIYFHIYKKYQNEIYAIPVYYDVEKEKVFDFQNDNLKHFYDIAPSQDEKSIVGILIDPNGQKNIALYSIENKIVSRLAENIKGIKPFFLSDKLVAYLEYDYEKQQTALVQIDIQTKQKQEIGRIEGKARDPYLKDNVLYISSDANGVYNIYRYDIKTKVLTPLTNVETRSYFPRVSSQELYFVYMAKSGYNLASVSLSQIPQYTKLVNIKETKIQSEIYSQGVVENQQVEDYSAFSWLRPHWWLPYLKYEQYKAFDVFQLGLFTSWSDPLERHSILLMANYDMHEKNINYLFNYEYNGKRGFLIELMAMKSNLVALTQGYQDFYHEGMAGYRLNTFDYSWSAKAGGFYDYQKTMELLGKNQSIYGIVAATDFSNRDYFRESFRKANGFYVGIDFRKYLDPDMNEITAKINLSIGNVLLEKAVFSLLNTTSGVFGPYVDQQGIMYYNRLGSKYFSGYENFPVNEYFADKSLLRGYDNTQVGGNYYWLTSAEYLIPILEMVGGYGSMPFYLRGIYVNAFFDLALTSNKDFIDLTKKGPYYSFGGELGMATLLFYGTALDLLVGYARNVEYQTNHWYFVIKVPFGETPDIKTGVSNQQFYRNLKQM